MTIAYGARCLWWDDKSRVGRTSDGRLPACPHCGNVLFEMEDAKWEAGRRIYNAMHPGYTEFNDWARGKCFPNLTAARMAYKEETGKDYEDPR